MPMKLKVKGGRACKIEEIFIFYARETESQSEVIPMSRTRANFFVCFQANAAGKFPVTM